MRTKANQETRPRIIIKKVKDKRVSYHGGAWKVAYADFVTAMMALFIILWILAATDNNVKAGLAQYFRDPGIFQNSVGILPDGEGVVRDEAGKTSPLEELQGRLAEELLGAEELASIQDQIRIQLTPEGLKIEMMDKASSLFFDLSSAELKPMLLQVLARIAKQLKGAPHRISIGGHTDARPYHDSSFYSNWELSAARALNARRAMERFGLGLTRVERVTGYADQSPLIAEDPLDPVNRRITIIVLRRSAALPGLSLDSLPASAGLPHQ